MVGSRTTPALGGLNGTSDHPRTVSFIMRAASPDSHIYCRVQNDNNGGLLMPTQGDLDGTGGNAPIHVVNISAGLDVSGVYDSTNNSSRGWDNFSYANDVPVFKSAGNRGNDSGFVTSPGIGPNSLIIGNYDDSNGTIRSNSSIRDPNTRSLKPELSAPGTTIFVNGENQGSGTSYAAPHVAAMAANYLEAVPSLRLQAAAIRATMIAASKRPVDGAGDRTGIGGADYKQLVSGAYTYWMNGGNGFFDTKDAEDGDDDGWVTRYRYLSSSHYDARLVLTWQSDGDYVFANATDAQPLGSNYDIRVFDPNGAYVGCGCSATDQYEELSFDPVVSGNYKIEFRRLNNPDSDAKTDVSWSLNWR